MKTMQKIVSYLLVSAVIMFISACDGNSTSGGVDAEYTSGVINLPAPDLVEVESEIAVENEVEEITKITVALNITHNDYFSDMYIWLESPSGTEVYLSDQDGPDEAGSIDIIWDDDAESFFADPYNDDGIVDIVGTFYGDESLSSFNGEDANGVWTLHVEDDYEGDGTGNIVSWGINIE